MSTVIDQSTPQVAKARTYGGWHRPKGFGIWIFGPVGTVLAGVGAVIFIFLIPILNIAYAAGFAVLWGGMLFLLVKKNRHGRALLDGVADSWAYRRAKRSGSISTRGGSLTERGSYPPPGTLATTRLIDCVTDGGEEFAILRYTKPDLYAICATAEPEGTSLLDPEELDDQVERYGEWLASLADEEGLVQAAVTLETTLDGGPTLTREMKSRESSQAVDLSKRVMGSVLSTYPTQGNAIRAYVSATFEAPRGEVDEDGKKVKRRKVTVETIADHLATRLPDLLEGLQDTGAGDVALMTGQDFVQAVRCAWSPDALELYDQLAATGQPRPHTSWNHVGPGHALAHKTYYEHDGYASITYEVTGFTSTRLMARALAPILEPHPRIMSKRVTFLYEPIDPAMAGIMAEADHNATTGRIINSPKPSARQAKQVDSSDETRHHEAAGAALMNFAILVQLTVKIEDLPKARSAIKRLGPTARLHLRSMDSAQDSSFAAAQGCLGLVIKKHLAVSANLTNGI